MKKLLLSFVLAALVLTPFSASATYLQQYALGQDSTFQQQVAVAMIITAANVMTENATIAGHVARAAFANRVIQDPTKWNPILAAYLASQTNNAMTPVTVPSTVADSLVQTAMDNSWGNLSGYFKQ